MKSPYSNPYLSARAKGVFAYYAELGRPVSADEMSAVMPEGRDALQLAINELKRFGYIITTREQVNGKWNSYMKFTESAKKLLSTDTGFSGLLYVYSDTATVTSTNDLSTVDKPIVGLLRNPTISRTASLKEGEEMGWNLDGEETPEPSKVKVAREAEATPGAVGKILDKAAMRKEKYGAQSQLSVKHRSHKPESEWNTKDLVSEFGSLLNQSPAGHLTMQVNGQQFASWINQQVGKGVSRQNILAAIRMFFEDPRNLHDAGVGAPLWRRFIGYYQTVEGKVTREELPESYDEEMIRTQQEKMLKLLGGK